MDKNKKTRALLRPPPLPLRAYLPVSSSFFHGKASKQASKQGVSRPDSSSGFAPAWGRSRGRNLGLRTATARRRAAGIARSLPRLRWACTRWARRWSLAPLSCAPSRARAAMEFALGCDFGWDWLGKAGKCFIIFFKIFNFFGYRDAWLDWRLRGLSPNSGARRSPVLEFVTLAWRGWAIEGLVQSLMAMCRSLWNCEFRMRFRPKILLDFFFIRVKFPALLAAHMAWAEVFFSWDWRRA